MKVASSLCFVPWRREGAESLFARGMGPDRLGTREQRGGFVSFPLDVIDRSQVLKNDGDGAVVGVEILFADGESALEILFRWRELTEIAFRQAKTIQGCGNVFTVVAESFLLHGKSAFSEFFGGGRVFLEEVQEGQVAKRLSGIGMFGSKSLFTDGESPLVQRFSLVNIEAVLIAVEVCEILKHYGEVAVIGVSGLLVLGTCLEVIGFGLGVVMLSLGEQGCVVEGGAARIGGFVSGILSDLFGAFQQLSGVR